VGVAAILLVLLIVGCESKTDDVLALHAEVIPALDVETMSELV
jgi:hypothetical protein